MQCSRRCRAAWYSTLVSSPTDAARHVPLARFLSVHLLSRAFVSTAVRTQAPYSAATNISGPKDLQGVVSTHAVPPVDSASPFALHGDSPRRDLLSSEAASPAQHAQHKEHSNATSPEPPSRHQSTDRLLQVPQSAEHVVSMAQQAQQDTRQPWAAPWVGMSSFRSRLRPSSSSQQSSDYVQKLAMGVKEGDRLSISRSITLCESSHPAHAKQAADLLLSLERLNQLYGGSPSFRVGVTGPPGAGKSCLMEALGVRLIKAGSRVAVLAIDPSSEATGGAILGDKLRMPQYALLGQHAAMSFMCGHHLLTASEQAYVRPSPTRGTLGGVARATSDAIFICESAGYDQVLVETVGLGQSETMFSELVDCAVLVLPPLGGDEWQAMKKGIMEVVDILAVNKADGPALQAALSTVSSYTGAMSFLSRRHRHWAPKVLAVSARSGYQLERLQQYLHEYREQLNHSGELQRQRSRQRGKLFWLSAEEQLLSRFRHSEQVPGIAARILPNVVQGTCTIRAAADQVVDQFLQLNSGSPPHA